LAQGAVGITFTASALVVTLPPALASQDPAVTMRRLPQEVPDSTLPVTVTMRRLSSTPALTPESGAIEPDSGVKSRVGGAVVVIAGDHLWAISARAMKEGWGREPTDREIDPYWRAVIERNRSRLADPNLIFPGDTIELPPVPPRPGA
jgi:nucleoid-associated protein YgaU